MKSHYKQEISMENLVPLICSYNKRIKYIGNALVEISILKHVVLTEIAHENVSARLKNKQNVYLKSL